MDGPSGAGPFTAISETDQSKGMDPLFPQHHNGDSLGPRAL